MKVPKGWKKDKFSNVLAIIKDGTHFSPSKFGGKNLYITSKNIKMGYLDLSNVSYIPDDEHEKIYSSSPVKFGDVLLTKDGANTGNVAINNIQEPFSLLSSVAYLRGKKNIIDNLYLLQWLLSPKVQYEIKSEMAGQAITRLTLQKINHFEIYYPPLSEQKAIADILSTWDQAIDKLEKLIAGKEKKFKWLLNELITKNRSKRVKLKELSNEISTRNTENIERVLSVTNTKGFILPEEQFGKKVSSDDLSNYKIVNKGQYAYNPSRINVGSIARLDDWDIAVLSPMYVVFEVKEEKINSDYFLFWLSTAEAKQRIKLSAQGSVRETVNYSDLCSIKISLPTKEKQQEIADKISLIQTEIRYFHRIKEQYVMQKQGLMQKLLTGKWRVKI
ncbi:MAG TPA: restriction endonuclease subunit S [Clostridiales bacterium]|nr:restriction endonuclease subunit S [Clostridiales bacterium]